MRCENCAAQWSITVEENRKVRFCPVCGRELSIRDRKQPDSIEKTLRLIVQDYGIGHLHDGARTVAFFSDLAPQLKKEKILLQHFLRCNGNILMISALDKTPAEQQTCMERVVADLMEDMYVSETAARLVCTSFWNAIYTPKPEPPVQPAGGKQTYQEDEADKKETAAVKLLIRAASMGSVDAQIKLAGWYREGTNVDRNPRKAYYWYQQAAATGNTNAQCNLGWCHASGFGVPQNPRKAVYWFTSAANAGVPVAQYNLAKCFEEGSGTEKDLARAAKWYEKAAKAGHPNAQYRTGRCYAEGIGVARDPAMAFYWFNQAAKNRSVSAQYEMGECYAKGKGVDLDRDLAYYWYKQAADNGHSEAREALVRML